MATKDDKQAYVLRQTSRLMDLFEIQEVQVSNLDVINCRFQTHMQTGKDYTEQFDVLQHEGFDKTDSKLATIYHFYDDETSVATNVSIDKGRQNILFSLNY